MYEPLEKNFVLFFIYSEHQQIANKVHKFLNLDEKNTAYDEQDSSDSEEEDDATGDDFERIDKSELLDECDEVGSPLDKEEKESQESCIEKTE